MKELRAGILGSTGIVGQRFVQILGEHPLFRINRLFASGKNAGKLYGEVVNWKLETELPERIAQIPISPQGFAEDCDLLFSALPSSAARDIEWEMASKGIPVISNASTYRMDPLVPLVIPEINPGHIELIPVQQKEYGFGRGFIVTNPNCSTIGLCLGILPVFRTTPVNRINGVTIQAVSGAGYPGVSALDILGNILPEIPGEEEKLRREPLKIFGEKGDKAIQPAPISISLQCNRAPVRDGHLISVSLGLENKMSIPEIKEVYRNLNPKGFGSVYFEYQPIKYKENDFFQLRDLNNGSGMSVTVTRIEPCEVLDFRLVILVHNTIRGAAGAAVLNAELLYREGFIQKS